MCEDCYFRKKGMLQQEIEDRWVTDLALRHQRAIQKAEEDRERERIQAAINAGSMDIAVGSLVPADVYTDLLDAKVSEDAGGN